MREDRIGRPWSLARLPATPRGRARMRHPANARARALAAAPWGGRGKARRQQALLCVRMPAPARGYVESILSLRQAAAPPAAMRAGC